jgi:hypothetical protein
VHQTAAEAGDLARSRVVPSRVGRKIEAGWFAVRIGERCSLSTPVRVLARWPLALPPIRRNLAICSRHSATARSLKQKRPNNGHAGGAVQAPDPRIMMLRPFDFVPGSAWLAPAGDTMSAVCRQRACIPRVFVRKSGALPLGKRPARHRTVLGWGAHAGCSTTPCITESGARRRSE